MRFERIEVRMSLVEMSRDAYTAVSVAKGRRFSSTAKSQKMV